MARERPVTIQGSKEACDRAKQLILEIVESGGSSQSSAPQPIRQEPGTVTETMKVPHESAGYIIGKGKISCLRGSVTS